VYKSPLLNSSYNLFRTESYNDLLEQLMTSERILLNSLPVKINTKSTELFKNINQKMINYSLEFDFAFNAINNVI